MFVSIFVLFIILIIRCLGRYIFSAQKINLISIFKNACFAESSYRSDCQTWSWKRKCGRKKSVRSKLTLFFLPHFFFILLSYFSLISKVYGWRQGNSVVLLEWVQIIIMQSVSADYVSACSLRISPSLEYRDTLYSNVEQIVIFRSVNLKPENIDLQRQQI